MENLSSVVVGMPRNYMSYLNCPEWTNAYCFANVLRNINKLNLSIIPGLCCHICLAERLSWARRHEDNSAVLTWCRAGIGWCPGGLGAGHPVVPRVTGLLVTRTSEARVPVLAADLPGAARLLHAGEVPHTAGPDVHSLCDLRQSDNSLVQLNIAEAALEHGTRGLYTLSITKLSTFCSLTFSSNRK